MATTDAEFITVLRDLPATLRTIMHLRGKSLRDVAQETGLSHTIVMRLANGSGAGPEPIEKICAWLAGPG
jgi:transcriptional regulator with XRE-family HTH domain